MIVRNNLILISSLGRTDCQRSQIYYEDNKIFVERVRGPEEMNDKAFVALPIVAARLPSREAIREANTRILRAQRLQQIIVDVTDLERDPEDFS